MRVAHGDVNDHTAQPAGWLSNVTAKQTEGQDFRRGVTIDQIIAKQIGQDSPLLSLEVATEDFTGYMGGCSRVHLRLRQHPVVVLADDAAADGDQPAGGFRADVRPGRHRGQRLARLKENRSVLDSIRDDAEDLQRGLPVHDRRRIDEYLDTIREIERRLQAVEGQGRTQLTSIETPVGIPEAFDEHVGLLFDLLPSPTRPT